MRKFHADSAHCALLSFDLKISLQHDAMIFGQALTHDDVVICVAHRPQEGGGRVGRVIGESEFGDQFSQQRPKFVLVQVRRKKTQNVVQPQSDQSGVGFQMRAVLLE